MFNTVNFIIFKVQAWKGQELRPQDYGWRSENGVLVPEQGYTEICPKEIALSLKCGCKTSCTSKACSCRKSDIDCTEWCKCSDACLNHTRMQQNGQESDSSEDEGLD